MRGASIAARRGASEWRTIDPTGIPLYHREEARGPPQTRLRAVLMTDRSHYPVRKTHLADKDKGAGVGHVTPGERLAMVWQLTLQAWMFKEGLLDEPRLRRDVVRTLRSRR